MSTGYRNERLLSMFRRGKKRMASRYDWEELADVYSGEDEGRHPSREGLRRSDEGLKCLTPLADRARYWVLRWHGGDSGGC